MSRLTHCFIAALLVSAAACHSRTHTYESGGDVGDTSAEVVMRSSTGTELGTLRMERQSNGSTRLAGSLTGVPTGSHGIHLHSVGRCDAPTFETAGGHFNPQGKQHGLRNPAGPHAGDAPNVAADPSRHAHVDVTLARATMSDSKESGLWDADGAAVVLHASADDQKTDPSGNSGARIACGVVTPAR